MQVIDGGLVAEIVTKYEVHIYDEDNQKIVNMSFDGYEKADFLADLYPKSVGEALIKISNGDKEKWEEWLKEIHKMKHSTSESYSITRCASKTVKPILTNEEWFCNLDTEDKAREISDMTAQGYWSEELVEEWLKQPHKGD